MKDRLIVIAGPTASGKTSAGVELCKLLGGEVISCDSMQLYRGMDVGTAKPTRDEMHGVPHHMIDVLYSHEACSAAAYKEMATPTIKDIIDRGKLPVMVGGTGLYINAITRPMDFASTVGDEGLRAELEAVAQTEGGKEQLYQQLSLVDSETAAKLHVNDTRRVIRALEIYKLTGRTKTALNAIDAQQIGGYDEKIFCISWDRDILYDRINRRVDEMLKNGLIDETIALLDLNLPDSSTAMQAIGYKEIALYLKGELTLDKAIDLLKQRSRNYAKRQLTWFRRDDRVIWIDASKHIDIKSIVDEMVELGGLDK